LTIAQRSTYKDAHLDKINEEIVVNHQPEISEAEIKGEKLFHVALSSLSSPRSIFACLFFHIV
jgi:hypothetical protein